MVSTHFKHISQIGSFFRDRGENKKCLKPRHQKIPMVRRWEFPLRMGYFQGLCKPNCFGWNFSSATWKLNAICTLFAIFFYNRNTKESLRMMETHGHANFLGSWVDDSHNLFKHFLNLCGSCGIWEMQFTGIILYIKHLYPSASRNTNDRYI